MEEKKICCTCKKEFPKNKDFFFYKKDSYKLASGERVIFYKITSDCKKCHGQKRTKRLRLERCKELGCTEKEYKQTVIKIIAEKKLKYKFLKNISASNRQHIINAIDRGYIWVSKAQWDEDVKTNIIQASINRRKFDYGNKPELTTKDKNKAARKAITKACVANRFRIPVKELPNEIYETYRNIILLKRELNFGSGINR